MVRDVGQRGKWGGTGRLTANFSLLATPGGAANGRRTNAVMPNGHHSLHMPPHGPIFPYSLRFPHHPTRFHTLPGALYGMVPPPQHPFPRPRGQSGHILPPFPFPHPSKTAVRERQKAFSVPGRSSKTRFHPHSPRNVPPDGIAGALK